MTEILVEKKNCQILKSITRHNCATSLSDRERLYDFSVQYVEVCEVSIVSKIGKFFLNGMPHRGLLSRMGGQNPSCPYLNKY